MAGQGSLMASQNSDFCAKVRPSNLELGNRNAYRLHGRGNTMLTGMNSRPVRGVSREPDKQ